MRRTNWPIVALGFVFFLLAAALFLGMLFLLAPKSNDPATMMRLVGIASGVVAALGLPFVVIGLLGRGGRSGRG